MTDLKQKLASGLAGCVVLRLLRQNRELKKRVKGLNDACSEWVHIAYENEDKLHKAWGMIGDLHAKIKRLETEPPLPRG